MNLHGIVRGMIGAVNPDITATLLQATGANVTAPNGKRTPGYNTLTGMSIQVQAVSGRDIERMNGLGIQGVFRSVHLDGYWRGIVRVDQVGGDLMEFPEVPGGAVRTWKVTTVAETWPDWSRVIVVLQT